MPKRLTNTIRDDAPCKDCTEKFMACHDSCDLFKKWTAEKERVKAERNKFLKEISIRKKWYR